MDRDLRVTTTGTGGPPLPPDQGAPVGWEEWRPPSTSGRAVPLGELLTIAVLTPAQAVLVTADLLEFTGARPPERVRAVLRADGAVDVSERGSGIPGIPLPDLLDEVVRNARRLRAHPQPDQLRMLRTLEEQVGTAGDPAQRAAVLREALAQAGGGAVARIRGELAALVKAFNAMAPSSSTTSPHVNGHTVASSPLVGTDSPRPRPQSHRQPHRQSHPHPQTSRRRARNRRMLIVLVALALVLVGGGYAFLRGPGSGLLDSVRGGSSGGTQPAPSHAPAQHQPGNNVVRHGATFPALAALAAGRVRGVVVQPAKGCHPRTTCGVKVTVHLASARASQAVGWRVGVVRRCGRRVIWSPKTTITAQPGWAQVFASSPVQIPKGRSLALVALTTSPNHAQSRPVPVAGTSLHC